MLGLSSNTLIKSVTGKKLSRAGNNAVLWLLGLTICYQVVYQSILLKRLHDTESSELVCDDVTDAHNPQCIEIRLFRTWKNMDLKPPSSNTSVLVLEHLAQEKLVERMNTLTLAPILSVMSIMSTASPQEASSRAPSSFIVGDSHELVSFGTAEKIEKIYNETLTILNSHPAITPYMQSIMDMKARLEAKKARLPNEKQRRRKQWLQDFDRLYNESLAAIESGRNTSSEWAQKAKAMMEQFDARNARLPSTIKQKAAERRAEFDKLYNDTLNAGSSHNNTDAWADHLKSIRDQFAELDRRNHNRTQAADKHDLLRSELTKHTAALEAELAKIRRDHQEWQAAFSANASASLRELCAEPTRRSYPACVKFLAATTDASATYEAQLAKISHDHKEWQDAFSADAGDYLKNLCSDSERKSYPVCEQFLAGHLNARQLNATAYEAELAKLRHDHQQWQESFSAIAADSLRHLCSEEFRASYPVCVKFLAADAATAANASTGTAALKPAGSALPASPNLRGSGGYHDRLDWANVLAAVRNLGNTLGQDLATVDRSQLQSLKWQGRIPKIACVAAIPGGATHLDRVKATIDRVINNFRMQNYEGPRQLLLLYPHAETEVAELVAQVSDGAFIKGVPARNHGEFPSTTAYRYAAWSTDADIIARWNADEWYHPDRLSMQINAMALAKRPVSLLKRWTVLGSENASSGTVLSDKIGWEGSIVGEAAWMKEHWMPLLYAERQVLGGVQANGVVQVDVPELSIQLPKEEADLEGALRHFGLSDHAETPSEVPQLTASELPQACQGLHSSAAHELLLLNETSVVATVGVELGEMYGSLLTRRSEVEENLRSLCDDVRMAQEPLRRESLVRQVTYMAGMRQHLTDHFEAVKALFTDYEGMYTDADVDYDYEETEQ